MQQKSFNVPSALIGSEENSQITAARFAARFRGLLVAPLKACAGPKQQSCTRVPRMVLLPPPYAHTNLLRVSFGGRVALYHSLPSFNVEATSALLQNLTRLLS